MIPEMRSDVKVTLVKEEEGGGQKRAREKIIKKSPKVNMWSGFSLPDVGDMFRFLLL
jgi:hypothetical protein